MKIFECHLRENDSMGSEKLLSEFSSNIEMALNENIRSSSEKK
jgi:hypothetical protein